MRKMAFVFAALSATACVQPPNPAVETIKAAREFNKLAQESQRAQGTRTGASDEVAAFRAADERLHYGNASIVRDEGGCAYYQGTTPEGQSARVPLTTPAGQPICRR